MQHCLYGCMQDRTESQLPSISTLNAATSGQSSPPSPPRTHPNQPQSHSTSTYPACSSSSRQQQEWMSERQTHGSLASSPTHSMHGGGMGGGGAAAVRSVPQGHGVQLWDERLVLAEAQVGSSSTSVWTRNRLDLPCWPYCNQYMPPAHLHT